MELPLVYVTIPRFDRREADPLCLEGREYVLDWLRATPAERIAILAHIQQSEPKPRSGEHCTTGWTITVESPGRDAEFDIVSYRHLFREIEDEAERMRLYAEALPRGGIRPLRLPLGYAEDEAGNPITTLEQIACIKGDDHFIVMGDPESILRLPPSGMRDQKAWSQDSANIIEQFIRVVGTIVQSRWSKSPYSFTFLEGDDGRYEVLEADFAESEDTRSILACVRQLYSSDNLYNHACNTYMRHCAAGANRAWIDDRKKCFNRCLITPLAMAPAVPIPTRNLLDLVMYAAGIMHAKSRKSSDKDELRKLLEHYGDNVVVVRVQQSLQFLTGYAADTARVIERDFANWTKNLGCLGPDILRVDGL